MLPISNMTCFSSTPTVLQELRSSYLHYAQQAVWLRNPALSLIKTPAKFRQHVQRSRRLASSALPFGVFFSLSSSFVFSSLDLFSYVVLS
eukprot:m.167413 g.167413  ORF g.167413 m.167413 type:complete len:90 (-) comp10345_c1_seq2:86-355(-)